MTPLDLPSPQTIGIWLATMNVVAFIAFGIDKACARAGHRRISEATLLTWAMVGGTAGAFAGRAVFRHKTRKQPFSSQLFNIAVLQVAAVVGLAIFLWP